MALNQCNSEQKQQVSKVEKEIKMKKKKTVGNISSIQSAHIKYYQKEMCVL